METLGLYLMHNMCIPKTQPHANLCSIWAAMICVNTEHENAMHINRLAGATIPFTGTWTVVKAHAVQPDTALCVVMVYYYRFLLISPTVLQH